MKNVPWYSEVPFIKCQIIIWFQLRINDMQPQRSVPSNPAYLTLNPGCKVKHMLDKETHLCKRKLCQRRRKIIFQAAHCNYFKKPWSHKNVTPKYISPKRLHDWQPQKKQKWVKFCEINLQTCNCSPCYGSAAVKTAVMQCTESDLRLVYLFLGLYSS